MANYEFIIKLGDQTPLKKGYKDGMFVTFSEEGYKWGERVLKDFAILKIPNLTEREAQEMCCPVTNEKKVIISATGKFINIDTLGDKAFIASLRDHEAVNPILAIDSAKTAIFDTKDYDYAKNFLAGSITSGTYQIGGGTPDYNTIKLFSAALGNLTGNLIGNICGDITEIGTSFISITLAGYTLTLTTPAGVGRHSGYGQVGDYIITAEHNDSYEWYIDAEGPGVIDISWLHCIIGTTGMLTAWSKGYDTTTGLTLNIHNNLFNGNARSRYWNYSGFDINQVVHIYNNIFWNNFVYIINLGGANIIFENNSVYDCLVGIDANDEAGVYVNNAVFGGTNRSFYRVANAALRHNCTYDAIAQWGSTPLINDDNLQTKTFTDNFESSTSTDPTFFKVKSTATDVLDSGYAITYSTIAIRGNTRTGTPDIGADEYISAGGLIMPIAIDEKRRRSA